MSKRRYLLLLPFLLLSSCSHEAFRQYFGNMEEVSFSLPFSDIDQKEIVSEDWKNAIEAEREQENTAPSGNNPLPPKDPVLEKTYYADIFVLSTQTELDSFFAQDGLIATEEEKKEYCFMPSDLFYVIVLAQIPEGYESFKRENIQSTDDKGNMIIISDNFYSFSSRPEINYFFIDLKYDTEKKEHVSAFLFEVSRKYLSTISSTTIRPVYSWGKK